MSIKFTLWLGSKSFPLICLDIHHKGTVCVCSHSPTLLLVCCSLSSMDCPSSSFTLLLRLVPIPQQNRTRVPLSLGLEHSLLRRRGRPCHLGACSLGKTAKKRVKEEEEEEEEEEEAECHLLLKYAVFIGVWHS